KKEGRDAVATRGRGPDGGERVEHALGAAAVQETPRCHELEPRPVVTVDDAGAGEESRHTSLSQEQVPEILPRPIDPQVLETELSQRPVRTHEPLEPRRLVDEGPRRPEHHHVAGRAEPDLHVWQPR